MKYHLPRLSSSSGLTLAIITIIVAGIILIIAVLAAGASPSCMTFAEARAKFPNKYLHWRTPKKCWDYLYDHPGLGSPKAKWLPKPLRDANGNLMHHSGRPLLNDVQWRPRLFDGASALEPPIVLGVVDHRWPGSYVIEGPVVVLDPITQVAELQFNELDERAGQ